MGHLVNALSFRLGWFSNWTDIWFSEYIYYSEFLFMVLRVRLFLVYFFSLKSIEKLGFFYSHFSIFNKYNTIFVSVYIYDGLAEDKLREFGFIISKRYKRKLLSAKKNERFIDKRFWKLMSVFFFFNNFIIYSWPRNRLVSLSKLIMSFKKESVRRYVLDHIFWDARGSSLRFIFFFYLYIEARRVVNFLTYNNVSRPQLLTSRFAYVFSSLFVNNALFYFFRIFLWFIFSILTNYSNIRIQFFAISRAEMNAKFLSRFIARKLRQNYYFWNLLKPIKRELYRTNLMFLPSLLNYQYFFSRYELRRYQGLNFKKGVFRFLFHFYCLFI